MPSNLDLGRPSPSEASFPGPWVVTSNSEPSRWKGSRLVAPKACAPAFWSDDLCLAASSSSSPQISCKSLEQESCLHPATPASLRTPASFAEDDVARISSKNVGYSKLDHPEADASALHERLAWTEAEVAQLQLREATLKNLATREAQAGTLEKELMSRETQVEKLSTALQGKKIEALSSEASDLCNHCYSLEDEIQVLRHRLFDEEAMLQQRNEEVHLSLKQQLERREQSLQGYRIELDGLNDGHAETCNVHARRVSLLQNELQDFNDVCLSEVAEAKMLKSEEKELQFQWDIERRSLQEILEATEHSLVHEEQKTKQLKSIVSQAQQAAQASHPNSQSRSSSPSKTNADKSNCRSEEANPAMAASPWSSGGGSSTCSPQRIEPAPSARIISARNQEGNSWHGKANKGDALLATVTKAREGVPPHLLWPPWARFPAAMHDAQRPYLDSEAQKEAIASILELQVEIMQCNAEAARALAAKEEAVQDVQPSRQPGRSPAVLDFGPSPKQVPAARAEFRERYVENTIQQSSGERAHALETQLDSMRTNANLVAVDQCHAKEQLDNALDTLGPRWRARYN